MLKRFFQGTHIARKWYSTWNRYILMSFHEFQHVVRQSFIAMENGWLSDWVFRFISVIWWIRIRMQHWCHLKQAYFEMIMLCWGNIIGQLMDIINDWQSNYRILGINYIQWCIRLVYILLVIFLILLYPCTKPIQHCRRNTKKNIDDRISCEMIASVSIML